jgi:putative transposase
LFRTLKYRPGYPLRAFESLLTARQWDGTFVQWYNDEQRHAGQDTTLLAKRV